MHPGEQWTCRRARVTDAAALVAIYNESVDGGGHSPVLRAAGEGGMRHLIATAQRQGWPLWVMLEQETVVGWALLRSIVWGPEVSRHVGDLWVYVARRWHGSGAAMQLVRNVYHAAMRSGFEAVTCWILGSNRRSLTLARACRMERWGLLPRAARYGGHDDDVEIWGVWLDDERWLGYMDRLDARHVRRRAMLASRETTPG